MNFKLGKLSPEAHPNTLRLAKYMTGLSLPTPPEKRAWEYALPAAAYGMLLNDQLGDCVEAGMLHFKQCATANGGGLFTPTDTDAQKLYSAIAGYVPGNPTTDNGTVMTQAMSYWQSTGIDGEKILGWAALDTTDIATLRQAIYLFGGILVGVKIYSADMDEAQSNKAWNLTSNDGTLEGGHCIPIFGYGALGQTCVTWGMFQQMSVEWLMNRVDEAYAVIDLAFIKAATKLAPNGFSLQQLEQDLQALKQ